MAARYVRISKFHEETGYTQRAVEAKIFKGVWVEGVHYRRAPDNNILMDMRGYERWVEGQPAAASVREESESR